MTVLRLRMRVKIARNCTCKGKMLNWKEAFPHRQNVNFLGFVEQRQSNVERTIGSDCSYIHLPAQTSAHRLAELVGNESTILGTFDGTDSGFTAHGKWWREGIFFCLNEFILFESTIVMVYRYLFTVLVLLYRQIFKEQKQEFLRWNVMCKHVGKNRASVF